MLHPEDLVGDFCMDEVSSTLGRVQNATHAKTGFNIDKGSNPSFFRQIEVLQRSDRVSSYPAESTIYISLELYGTKPTIER